MTELCSASRYSLSSAQFCEEDGREKKVRVFKNQCALPQERKRAEKKGDELWSRLFALSVEERSPRTPYLVRPWMRDWSEVLRILQRRRSGKLGSRRTLARGQSDARCSVRQRCAQQQEAERLGISPMELNDIECGRRSLDELKKTAIEEMDYSRERGANRR